MSRNPLLTILDRSSIFLPMNKLTLARRAAVIRGLIDGASIRAVSRMTQTDKDTVSKILVEVGTFCADWQNQNAADTIMDAGWKEVAFIQSWALQQSDKDDA